MAIYVKYRVSPGIGAARYEACERRETRMLNRKRGKRTYQAAAPTCTSRNPPGTVRPVPLQGRRLFSWETRSSAARSGSRSSETVAACRSNANYLTVKRIRQAFSNRENVFATMKTNCTRIKAARIRHNLRKDAISETRVETRVDDARDGQFLGIRERGNYLHSHTHRTSV